MQRDEILRALQTTQRGIRTKDYVSSLIDWDSADDAMKAAVDPYLLEVLLEAGRDAMLAIGLDPGVYDPYEEIIRDWLTSRSTRIAVDVNDETEKQIRASLSEGLNAGEGNTALAARVEAVMGLAATMRADLIAQTEVARAQSQADVFAWTQSGVVDGKEWFTAEDEKVCKFCGPMNGRVIALDGNYFTRGDVQTEDGNNRKGEKITSTYNHDYDDVVGPPLHPRCRCTLLPVRSSALSV